MGHQFNELLNDELSEFEEVRAINEIFWHERELEDQKIKVFQIYFYFARFIEYNYFR